MYCDSGHIFFCLNLFFGIRRADVISIKYFKTKSTNRTHNVHSNLYGTWKWWTNNTNEFVPLMCEEDERNIDHGLNFCWPDMLSSSYPCTNDIILPKNLTNVLYMLKPLYSQYTFLHVSALNGSSSGSTDIFCEQGQQNVSVLPEDGP